MEQATLDLVEAYSSYTPSDLYVRSFGQSGFVAFTGSVAGAGKDYFKDGSVERCDGAPCQSLTDRDQRPSDKGDYVYVSTEELRDMMLQGELIEYEPIERDGEYYFYSTSGLLVQALVDEGRRPFKDTEPNGVANLKRIAGNDGVVKAVHPVPDLTILDDGRTQWEHLLTDRDFEGRDFVDVLGGECGERSAKDLKGRLGKATEAGEIIIRSGLHEDENTLFVVNILGRTEEALDLTAQFIEEGIGRVHDRSELCISGREALMVLEQVANISRRALGAHV